MRVEQSRYSEGKGWESNDFGTLGEDANLVFLFGGVNVLKRQELLEKVYSAYPKARVVGCSTAGEICDCEVSDDALVVTALAFDRSSCEVACRDIASPDESATVARRLAEDLVSPDLTHVIVLSEGLNVNGSELVNGFREVLPENVTVTGGLSGDGGVFQETLVLVDQQLPKSDQVSAIGFYGSGLKVSYASLGGWDQFGPTRRVTRSKGNVLYELDGQSALDLYKSYLGEHAKDLPGSGLLFPLLIKQQAGDSGVVRTILGVNEEEQSITFAGDIPQGATAQLMKANFDRLIDGAIGAAKTTAEGLGDQEAEFALLISCVGRKMVLSQRVEEEVEGVREILGAKSVLTGFYSYGEISPFNPSAKCELHNQTMTITAFSETDA